MTGLRIIWFIIEISECSQKKQESAKNSAYIIKKVAA